MHHVTVIDYGIGNVYSVCNALLYAGASPLLTDDPSIIAKSERVILPGVGSFSHAMKNLRDKSLDGAIANFIATGRPFLGICVGMQVMMDYSTELGKHTGFGYIPGRVEKINSSSKNGSTIKVPHVGWAEVKSCNILSGNFLGLPAEDMSNNFFYFVHSFECKPLNNEHLLAVTKYGNHLITAAVGRDNITGFQFHPERSGPAGLALLSRFIYSS